MSSRRYNRRTTRPVEDLPSLFNDRQSDDAFELDLARATPVREGVDEFAIDPSVCDVGPAFRFMSLGSGSSGNCSYVGTDGCGLLVDAGVDNNFVTDRLLHIGVDMSDIRGILLTHDHADHVRFTYALLRRNPHMRLFATPRALEGILRRHNLSRRIKDYHSPIYKEHEYHFGPMLVVPFETSHDGTDNAGFAISCGGSTFVIATDMGMITERADYYMRRATALMIESNYDSGMLATGRYPEYLKSRIRGARGHMDNADTAGYVSSMIVPGRLRHIFLCHLSADNNTPAIALEALGDALRRRQISVAPNPAEVGLGQVFVTALPRYETSDLYVL